MAIHGIELHSPIEPYMKPLLKYPLLLLLSLAFFVVVIPYGMCARLFTGKHRLCNATRANSYFRISPAVQANGGRVQQSGVERFTPRNS